MVRIMGSWSTQLPITRTKGTRNTGPDERPGFDSGPLDELPENRHRLTTPVASYISSTSSRAICLGVISRSLGSRNHIPIINKALR
ncbi:MAG: hypothetical protein ACREMZ_16655 [Gemmatimonadales bacterium]